MNLLLFCQNNSVFFKIAFDKCLVSNYIYSETIITVIKGGLGGSGGSYISTKIFLNLAIYKQPSTLTLDWF